MGLWLRTDIAVGRRVGPRPRGRPHGAHRGPPTGEAGSLSLWGGTFVSIGAPLPSSPCTDVNSLSVSLLAAADTLFLMWAAQLSEGASDGDVPLRLLVQLPDGDELSVEIDPATVAPTQP